MIKWIREDGKILEFDVRRTTKLYCNSKFLGEIFYIHKLREDVKILEFENVQDDYKTYKLKVTDENIAQQILNKDKENKEKIDDFFNNLDNVELYCLSYKHYYIDKKTKDYEKTKSLNEEYFENKSEEWLIENKKYLVKTNERVKSYESPKTFYKYYKENIEIVEKKREEYRQTDKYKENLEIQSRLIELGEIAKTMTDAEFEDLTGLEREHYLEFV